MNMSCDNSPQIAASTKVSTGMSIKITIKNKNFKYKNNKFTITIQRLSISSPSCDPQNPRARVDFLLPAVPVSSDPPPANISLFCDTAWRCRCPAHPPPAFYYCSERAHRGSSAAPSPPAPSRSPPE